jgi:hypothetical protein
MTLIRFRFNTKCHETPGGEWKWRIMLEQAGEFHEILVKRIFVNVPTFTTEDILPIIGVKYHVACRGTLDIQDGVATISAS